MTCPLRALGPRSASIAGEFAEQILASWDGEILILVDPWRHLTDYLDSWNSTDSVAAAQLKETRRRLSRFAERVVYKRMLSEAAAALQPDASLDFIYIDANHAFARCLADLKSWYPKVRRGGIVAGHDYYNALALPDLEPDLSQPWAGSDPCELTSYGVKAAVDLFIAPLRVRVDVTHEDLPTWWFRKPA